MGTSQPKGWGGVHCLNAQNKQKGVAPDTGQCKICLRNDGKPDERLGVMVETWNEGSMSGRGTALGD